MDIKELVVPERILMGPGPSNISYRVLKVMATPIIGHLDPAFLDIMDEICQMLRELFKTKNLITIPISGTGSAGMETSFVNFIEPGDKVIIGVCGLFGERMVDVAERLKANVVKVESNWGEIISPEKMIDALKRNPDAKILAIVHAETSTGVAQPLEEIGDFIKDRDTLFLVDTVTSLGGMEVKVDEWGIDICYSGTQKCLSVPPGLSPLTISSKAYDVLKKRKTKVNSWYLDLTMLTRYWGKERFYHHTAPISMLFALREGLRIIMDEGVENRYARHKKLGDLLKKEFLDLGFTLFSDPNHSLPMLNAFKFPLKIKEPEMRQRLLSEYDIEVGGGLGKTKGKIWRVGLMGESCRLKNILYLVEAIKEIIAN